MNVIRTHNYTASENKQN